MAPIAPSFSLKRVRSCNCSLLEAAHLQQRHQEGQRGLCSLVFVGSIRMKTISTAAGGGVVQGSFQVVVSQEPIERRPSSGMPMFISGGAICFQTGRHRRTSLQRLLVEPSFIASLAKEALGADRKKVSVDVAALLFFKPVERLQACRKPFFVGGTGARQQQCLRQAGHWNMTSSLQTNSNPACG